MTETLSAFLLAATLAALTVPGRRGAALGGLGFGLAALCRPSVLPALALVAGAAVVTGPGGWRRRAATAAVMVAAAVATLAPWAWRNARALGEPVWTTTHGGYTLALANNPVYYAEVLDGPPGAVWSGPNQRRWWERPEPRDGRDDRAAGRPIPDRPPARGCWSSGRATSPAPRSHGWGGSGASPPRGPSIPPGSASPRPPGPSRSGSPWSSDSLSRDLDMAARRRAAAASWRCRPSTPSSGPT